MRNHNNISIQSVGFNEYQAHPDEPREERNTSISIIPEEVEAELRTNRFFLKKRVWKQARKFNHYR